MRLKRVTKKEYRFLYELLQEKTKEQNISHQKIPTYHQHCKFNQKRPYKRDWVILVDRAPVGRVYLTHQNEVGIHIKRSVQGFGHGSQALRMVLRLSKGPILANISPRNKQSQKFFQKHGFTLIQYTYKHE